MKFALEQTKTSTPEETAEKYKKFGAVLTEKKDFWGHKVVEIEFNSLAAVLKFVHEIEGEIIIAENNENYHGWESPQNDYKYVIEIYNDYRE